MMKTLIVLLIVIFLIISIASCEAAPSIATPSLTQSPDYIPDVLQNTGEYVTNSSCGLYEDDEYIVYMIDHDVFIYDKKDREARLALKYCNAFTYYNKKIYYVRYKVESSGEGHRYISEYDPKTGNIRTIKKMDKEIISFSAYDNRLYFSYQTGSGDETAYSLFSVGLNAGDLKKSGIQEIWHFCITQDKIYYTESEFRSPVCQYDLASGSSMWKRGYVSYPNKFEIKDGSLFHIDDNDSVNAVNIDSGETTDIVNTGGYGSDFALLGQYILILTPGDYINGKGPYLKAYDINTEKTYKLMNLDLDYWYQMYTTAEGAFISRVLGDGSHILYGVIIEGGKAALEEIVDYCPYKQPSADTIIMASSGGEIYGGFSDGKWLTHGEAASYCKGNMKFYEYNLSGLTGTINSTGVSYQGAGGSYVYSQTMTMDPNVYDESGFFNLKIPELEGRDYNYNKNPLCYTYLYSAGPEKLPDIKVLSKTSAILPVIQGMVDEHFGKGNVKAEVRIAVSADIDGDGKKETIVNADNNGQARYDSIWGEAGDGEDESGDESNYDETANWYSVACIIESDGTVHIIGGYFENEYLDDSNFLYVQNIIDIDGDGLLEIVLDWSAWETYCTEVLKYDGRELTEVMCYDTGC